MKLLFINPHKSDFVFQSVAYNLIKRKSLQKYKYLIDFFNSNDTEFLYTSSSFNNFISKFRLNFIDKILLYFEIKRFRLINNLKTHTQTNVKGKYDFIFTFGFSIRDFEKEKIIDLASKSNFFVIHLSHYHLYAKKLNEWSSIPNIVFCADVDIQDYFFYKYFIDKKPKFFVLSFVINDKFTQKNLIRENKVISTGTFHEFEKIFTITDLKKDVVSNIFGSLTLHNERRILYKFRNKLKNLYTLNSSMGSLNIQSLFKFKSNVSQKSYFNQDIVTMYNSYNFAFVGEDIAGLPGIGIFEAIACGCVPIISSYCYRGTPLEYSRNVIRYNNINELISIIDEIDNYSHLITNKNEIEKLRKDICEFFSSSYQLGVLNNTFVKLLKEK